MNKLSTRCFIQKIKENQLSPNGPFLQNKKDSYANFLF
jgi:hypothetical protein